LRPARLWKPTRIGDSKSYSITRDWYSTKDDGLSFLKPSASDKEMLAWYQSAVYWAGKDPNIFMELAMENDWDQESRDTLFLKQSWFHRELQYIIEQGRPWNGDAQTRKLFKYLAIAFPRGFGKTTQIIGSILYELGRNPNARIKLVAETQETAQQRVYEVKTHIERNGYLRAIFPELKGTSLDQWTNGKLYIDRTMLSRDASLQAFGVLESATGGRADILIGDDVVGRRNALTQPKLREEVKSAWFSSWFPQLTRGGRCWYIFTPWHLQDLSHDIVTKEQFLTMVVTVGQHFESPWPEFQSQDDLKHKRELLGAIEFPRAYWLEALNESDSPVNEMYLKYIDVEDIEGDNWDFLLSADLAVGTAAGDLFAVVVFAVNRATKKAIVVDFININVDIIGQIDSLVALAEEYKPSWIVLESVAYQKSLYTVLKNTEKLGPYRGVLNTYNPTVSKRLRIEATVPLIESGRIQFIRDLSPHVVNGKKKGVLVRQLIDFGVEAHDDVADAFTQGALFLSTKLHLWEEVSNGVKVKYIGGLK
jgi:phage terminase large subunit-like protein